MLECLNAWMLERLNAWTLERLNAWTLERLNAWTLERLNTWMLEPLNAGTLECFKSLLNSLKNVLLSTYMLHTLSFQPDGLPQRVVDPGLIARYLGLKNSLGSVPGMMWTMLLKLLNSKQKSLNKDLNLKSHSKSVYFC